MIHGLSNMAASALNLAIWWNEGSPVSLFAAGFSAGIALVCFVQEEALR